MGHVIDIFERQPELFPLENREAIIHGQVREGMTPFEAKLAAGGGFSFKVNADTSRWPKNADPLEVMWTQSVRPDESEIWMTFRSRTQYTTADDATFRVHFKSGKAIDIERLEG